MKVERKINEFRVHNDSEFALSNVIKNLEELKELQKIIEIAKNEGIKIDIENKAAYFSNVYFDIQSYDNGIVIAVSERNENVVNLDRLEEAISEHIVSKEFALNNLTNIKTLVVTESLSPYILNLLNKKFNVIFEEE